MKFSSLKKVIYDYAGDSPFEISIIEIEDLWERRSNIAKGNFTPEVYLGMSWADFFEKEFTAFAYDAETETFAQSIYYKERPTSSSLPKSQKKGKKHNKKGKGKKSRRDLFHFKEVEEELDQKDMAKTITFEELERRKKRQAQIDLAERYWNSKKRQPLIIPPFMKQVIKEEDEEETEESKN